MDATHQAISNSVSIEAPDWRKALHFALLSRALDDLEESVLTPARKVLYQFSARGHELTQVLLAQQLTGQRDGVASYYRSRPLMLALGLPLDDALGSTMMRSGGLSDGRDIGVVFNFPNLRWSVRVARLRGRGHSVHTGGRLGPGAALSRRRT